MARDSWKPDTGWSWVVLATAFLSNMIVDGIHSAFGLFVSELLDQFDINRSTVAWTYSLLGGIMGLSGVCASVFINGFGARKTMVIGATVASLGLLLASYATHFWMLIATIGVITGCGFGLMHLCPFVMVSAYFLKRRSLAMGVITSGSGFGSFILPPLASVLISAYSWRGALTIFAGVILNGVVIGFTFMPVPRPRGSEQGASDSKKPLLNFSLLRRPSLLLHMLSCYLALTGIYVLILFLPDFAHSLDIPRHQSALLLSIFGGTSTLVRLAVGLISDRCKQVRPTFMLAVCLVSGGILAVVLSWVQTHGVLALCSVGIGLAMGSMVSLMPLLVIRLQGARFISDSFGFLSIACGLASLFGSPIAGGLYDATGSYTLAFSLAGASIITAGLLALPMDYYSDSQFTDCCRLSPIHTDDPENSSDKLDHCQTPLKPTNEKSLSLSGEVKENGFKSTWNAPDGS